MPATSRRAEVLLLVGSVAAFLLVGEVAVRLLAADGPRPTGYAPVNTNRRAMRPQNSAGYRDLERTRSKPAGTRRVVSLGDSFAWGASVEFEDAYPQRLERALTRRRAEPWQVVNIALPGMNTVDHEGQLRSEGLAYAPDVVLLGFVLNDSEDAAAAETRRAEDWAEGRSRPPGWLRHSALFSVLGHRLWATAENRRRIRGYRSMYAEDAPGWVAARQALKRMGALTRERGVPFVVVIFPLFGNPLDERYPFAEVHATVAQAAAVAGARVVDLLPAYRGLRWDILVVDGANDEHPNEIAHRIAAGAILHALDDVVPWTKHDEGPAAPPAAR
ncbi:MAG TPA: SGNH/GDSL hydrolase family protein [Vicinamibacteria bacterium]|nr:SGNH/GDSL hydrolase family protein [Vicinamibacteria bacterium]